MYKFTFVLFLLSILSGLVACNRVDNNTSTEQPKITLTAVAQPTYSVVGRLNVSTTRDQRSIGLWQITSGAKAPAEWVKVARQATLDLHSQYNTDFTEVLLTPNEHIIGITYAQVSYAADGKGSLGLDGADLIYYEWDIRVADRALTDEEYAIATLWEQKAPDFPSTNFLSTSSSSKRSSR